MSIESEVKKQFDILKEGVEEIVPEEDLLKKLKSRYPDFPVLAGNIAKPRKGAQDFSIKL